MIYGILVKTSGCAARPVTMSTNHIIGGGGLGSDERCNIAPTALWTLAGCQ